MAIKSKFIIFDTLSNFLSTNGIGGTAPSTDYIGNIPKGAVVFIKNTGLIWFNGNYFGIDTSLTYATQSWVTSQGYTKNTGTVTSIATGAGLTGGTITTSGTIKANLVHEIKASFATSETPSNRVTGRSYPVSLDSNGKLMVYVPWADNNTTSFTITANATDGLWDITGTSGTNAVTYAVEAYGSQQSKASFDTSSTAPTRSDRLNYNGYLYATKLFSGGVEVLTSHQSLSNYYTKTESDNKYVYKSGDTITGNLTVNGSTTLNKYITINPYNSDYGSNPVSLYWNDVKHTIVGNTKLDGTNSTAVDFLHSGNSSVSKSGETLTVKINGTSLSLTNTNTWNKVSTSQDGYVASIGSGNADSYNKLTSSDQPVVLAFRKGVNGVTDAGWFRLPDNAFLNNTYNLSNYLPLSGGTMKSDAYIGFDNDAAAFRMQIGADISTSPLRGITTPTVGGRWIGIFARPGKSTDEGGFLLSQEGAAIYNSFDSGFGFKVVDTDANLNDWNSADSVVFSVKNDNTVYSKGGFVKKGSSNSDVLLGGGGTKAISDFATASTTFVGYKFNDSIGGRNYFSKNTVVGSNITKTTSINGYTINYSNGINRILNLGFNGYVGNWTVTFEIKASAACSVYVNLCDTLASTTHGEQSTTSVTTEYVKHRYVFLNVNRYNTADNNGYNGFLDIENSESKTIYVKDIKIEKGIIASDWFYAPEDLATQTWVGSLITNGNVLEVGGFKVNEWGFLYKYKKETTVTVLNPNYREPNSPLNFIDSIGLIISFDTPNAQWGSLFIESPTGYLIIKQLGITGGLDIDNHLSGANNIWLSGYGDNNNSSVVILINGQHGHFGLSATVYCSIQDFTLTSGMAVRVASPSYTYYIENTYSKLHASNYAIFGDLIPRIANSTYNLGSSTFKWKNLYLSNNLSDGTNSLTVANIKSTYDWYLTMTTGNTDGTINKWKEIESFVNGISDTSTLNGILLNYFTYRGGYLSTNIANSLPAQTELNDTNKLNGLYMVPYSGASGTLLNFVGTGSARYVLFYTTYNSGMLWRQSTDANYNAWRTILDSSNYTSYINLSLSGYLPLSGGTMTGAAPIQFTSNTIALSFRTNDHASYDSKVEYMTNGNEALVFANKAAITSFIFKCGYSLINSSNWYASAIGTPTVLMKNQSLYVNSAIDSGVTPAYNFYVGGTGYISSNFSVNGLLNVTNNIIQSNNAILSEVSYATLQNSYGLRSDYVDAGYPDLDFLQSWTKYALDKAAGKSVVSIVSPNSKGVILFHSYNSGLNSTTNLPTHCTGIILKHGGELYVFGTANGTWYYRTNIHSGNISSYTYSKTDSDSRYLKKNSSSNASGDTGWGLYNFRKDISSTKNQGQEDNSVVDLLHMAQLRVMNSSNVWCTTIGVRDGLGWIDCVGSGLGYGDLYLKPTNSGAAIVGNYNGMGYKFSKNNLTEKFIVFGNERIVGNSTITGTLSVTGAATFNNNVIIGGVIDLPGLGEGFKIHSDSNYFGANQDGVLFTIKDGNIAAGVDGGIVFRSEATNNGTVTATDWLIMRYAGSNYGTFTWLGKNILHAGNTYVFNGVGTINNTTITSVANSDTVDGYHIADGWMAYLFSHSVTMSTVNTEWYLKIEFNPVTTYVYWRKLLIKCSYNNMHCNLLLEETGGNSYGIRAINNNQNGGCIYGVACSGYGTGTKCIMYIKMMPINDSSTGHYSPSTSTTVTVYSSITDFTLTTQTTVPTVSTLWLNALDGSNSMYVGRQVFEGHLYPNRNNAIDLGGSSYKWANVYATNFYGDLIGNATTASRASCLIEKDDVTFGWDGLLYFNSSISSVGTATTNGCPTNNYYHIIRMNHANPNGYFTDIACGINTHDMWYRRINSGAVTSQGWTRILDSNCYSSYALPLAGGTLTGFLGYNSLYLPIVKGGVYTTTQDVHTGCLTINLPADIGNAMTSMWVDVYNYLTGTSFSVHIGGYTYLTSTWQHNPAVMVYGASHRVRLGYNNGFKIYIGETNSTWHYPQILVRDVICGYQGVFSKIINNWSISFETTLPTIPDNANRVEYAWTTRNFNPSNYVTTSSLDNYVKKAGDTMTGGLIFARGTDDGFIFNKYNNTNYPVLRSHNNGNISLSASGSGLYIGYLNTSAIHFLTRDSIRMTIGVGNIGIGTASPSYNLHVIGSTYFNTNGLGAFIAKGTAGAYRDGIRIEPSSTGSNGWSILMLLGTDSALDSGTSANSWLVGSNAGNFYITRNGSNSSSSAILKCVSNQWSVSTSFSAVDFTATSDVRLKRDIQQISEHIYSFRFKDSDKLHYGFIALELEKNHPDLVGEGEYKTVNYNSALSLYVAELENRVKMLENEINNLKNK